MRGPPDQMYERAASAKAAPISQINSHPCSTKDSSDAAREFQARKLRRIYPFCHSTACTIATLAYGVCR